MTNSRERHTRIVDCGGFTRERSVCQGNGRVYSDSLELRYESYAYRWDLNILRFPDEAALRRLIADATELLKAWEAA